MTITIRQPKIEQFITKYAHHWKKKSLGFLSYFLLFAGGVHHDTGCSDEIFRIKSSEHTKHNQWCATDTNNYMYLETKSYMFVLNHF